MIDVGLLSGDKAVVDRTKSANIVDVVLAVVDCEFTTKMLTKTKSVQPRLMPANKDFKPIVIT